MNHLYKLFARYFLLFWKKFKQCQKIFSFCRWCRIPWPRRDLRLRTSDFRLPTSDFWLRTLDFRHPTQLRLRTSHPRQFSLRTARHWICLVLWFLILVELWETSHMHRTNSRPQSPLSIVTGSELSKEQRVMPMLRSYHALITINLTTEVKSWIT